MSSKPAATRVIFKSLIRKVSPRIFPQPTILLAFPFFPLLTLFNSKMLTTLQSSANDRMFKQKIFGRNVCVFRSNDFLLTFGCFLAGFWPTISKRLSLLKIPCSILILKLVDGVTSPRKVWKTQGLKPGKEPYPWSLPCTRVCIEF